MRIIDVLKMLDISQARKRCLILLEFILKPNNRKTCYTGTLTLVPIVFIVESLAKNQGAWQSLRGCWRLEREINIKTSINRFKYVNVRTFLYE